MRRPKSVSVLCFCLLFAPLSGHAYAVEPTEKPQETQSSGVQIAEVCRRSLTPQASAVLGLPLTKGCKAG